MPTELIFMWLVQLNQLVESSTNKLDCIESKNLLVSLSINSNRIKSKNLFISFLINPNHTKCKSFSDNCCKNNSAKNKKMRGEEVESNDSKGPK